MGYNPGLGIVAVLTLPNGAGLAWHFFQLLCAFLPFRFLPMASFSAQLRVAGHVFPVLRCAYHTSQATDGRGRVVTKVHYHPVELVLDVPDSDVLLAWAADPHKRQAADIVFLDPATGSAIETLHLAAAYCVGYRESFASGDTSTGAYQCHLTLSDPDGFTLLPGGPSMALLPGGSPLPSLTTAAEETALTQTAEAVTETVVEETAPVSLGVLARLLALLPEAGIAAALAVFVPTNSRNDPGYQSEWDMARQYLPLTDKDRTELAVLEQRHADGTLTAGEEAHLLALLARVKGLHLQKLADLRNVVPDFQGVHLAGSRGEAAGEFDGINMAEKLFIEDKSAKGLDKLNPKTGLRAQTPEMWAKTHIFDKTVKRINALANAPYTYPSAGAPPNVPAIEQIRGFRRLQFRVDADTPAVRRAVDTEIQNLKIKYPAWDFTAQYGY
jgi:hypothetical protein